MAKTQYHFTRQSAANHAASYLERFHPDWPTSRVRTRERGQFFYAQIQEEGEKWRPIEVVPGMRVTQPRGVSQDQVRALVRTLLHDERGFEPK